MTNEEWKKLTDKVEQLIKSHDVTKEEASTFRRVMRKLYGKCLICAWNDGCPHSACYSCDD